MKLIRRKGDIIKGEWENYDETEGKRRLEFCLCVEHEGVEYDVDFDLIHRQTVSIDRGDRYTPDYVDIDTPDYEITNFQIYVDDEPINDFNCDLSESKVFALIEHLID